MPIKSKQPKWSIVVSPSSPSPSPEKPPSKRCSFPAPRPKSALNPSDYDQSKQHQQILVDRLKTEDPEQIQKIKQHLKLIDSFDILIRLSQQSILHLNSKNQKHSARHGLDPISILNQIELEDIFYHLILFRFELWLGRIADHLPKSLFSSTSEHDHASHSKNNQESHQIELTLDFLPPLDVLFVWYCYCFNSRSYYEDSLRLYPILKHLKFPLELAASAYDCSSSIINYEKLKTRIKIKNAEAAQVLLRTIRTTEATSGTSQSHLDENMKNPSLLSTLLLPKNFNSKSGLNSNNLWLNLTNTNFNLIDFIHQPSFRTFICPLCGDTIESPFYVKNEETNLIEITEACWSYSSLKLRGTTTTQTSKGLNDGEEINEEETETIPIEKKSTILTNHRNLAKLNCHRCHWSGIKQDLSLFKFATELKCSLLNLSLKKNFANHGTPDLSAPINCLAGTLTTPENLNDKKNAILFNNLFHQEKEDDQNQNQNHTATLKQKIKLGKSNDITNDSLNYLKKIQNLMKFTLLNNDSIPFFQRNKIEKCFSNLLKSYCVVEPFSVDLIRSMKIQSHFIKRMVKLGWTEFHNPGNNPSVNTSSQEEKINYRLQSCISRYKAFCDLVSAAQPHLILIPTSDIDLAWKTERLRGVHYTESMMRKNKIMIDHPDEFDFDKYKFFDQFRLTSALWIHRYQIEYSRYPAPFFKAGCRQNWLKRALAHIPSSPESSWKKEESQNQVDSAQEKFHGQMKSTAQSQIQNRLPIENMNSKLNTQPHPKSRVSDPEVRHNSSGKKTLANLNHRISLPVRPTTTWEVSQGSKDIVSPDESVKEPEKTPDTILEHKTAQISVASYFKNIYIPDDPPSKPGTLSLKVTPSKQDEKHSSTCVEKEKEKENRELSKSEQVAQSADESSSLSVDTFYDPHSCPSSTISGTISRIDNQIHLNRNSQPTKPGAGIIYEARRISIKFAEDVKDSNNATSKIYSVTERSHLKKAFVPFNHPVPHPLPQTSIPPIKLLSLDSSVSPLSNNHHSLDQSHTQETIRNIQTQSIHQAKERSEINVKSQTTNSLPPNDHVRMNDRDKPRAKENNVMQTQLKTDKKVEIPISSARDDDEDDDTSMTIFGNERPPPHQSQMSNSLSKHPPPPPKLLNTQPFASLHVSPPSGVSQNHNPPSVEHHHQQQQDPEFFKIPIGKIAFVENGNILRCL